MTVKIPSLSAKRLQFSFLDIEIEKKRISIG